MNIPPLPAECPAMKITVTIEIPDSVYRGLIAESQKRGIPVSSRVSECVTECVPPLKHRHSEDWSRYGLSELPQEEFNEVRRRAVINRLDLERALNRYFIQKQLQKEG